MKVLWVVPFPIHDISLVVTGRNNIGAPWINSALSEIKSSSSLEMTIVSTWKIREIKELISCDSKYVCLPCGFPKNYKSGKVNNCNVIKKFIETTNPDIIQIWGTENSFGMDFINNNINSIPILIYMQGIIRAISRYPNGGLTRHEMCNYNILSNLKFPIFNKIYRGYRRHQLIESRMVHQSSGIISDNTWCFNWFKEGSSVKCYYHSLPLKDEFYKNDWNPNSLYSHRIFTVAGRAASKGLHVLIKAISIVIKIYPNLQLIIPGRNNTMAKSIRDIITRTPYNQYLKRLIISNHLKDNVIFINELSSSQMVEELKKSSLFIMPSCIENHSSSLREAMALGMPCISSFVGSTSEYVDHQRNGMLYRYEEHEQLAQMIIKLLSDYEFATMLGKNAKCTIIEKFYNNKGTLKDLYFDAISYSDRVIK